MGGVEGAEEVRGEKGQVEKSRDLQRCHASKNLILAVQYHGYTKL